MTIIAAFVLTATFGFGWTAKGWLVRENARFAEQVAAELAGQPCPAVAADCDVDGRRW